MISIRPYNTFKVSHKVGDIISATSKEEVCSILADLDNPIILGGGSNVLFTAHTNRPVIVIDIKGIDVLEQTDKSVLIKVAAGEQWHDFVVWAINNDFGGVENLSLIPGKCGAAPMQNIGAYGVELSELLERVHCIDRLSGKATSFGREECQLSYRDSIFKGAYKDKFVITAINLRLTKYPYHRINISYGDIKKLLGDRYINQPTIKDVSDAVIAIRSSKLPDPSCLPNAGSFFKNPIIPMTQFQKLKEYFPLLPSYPISEKRCKIPAGWLIDQCGWKGIMIGTVGVHIRQALVLVNHGTKNGKDILFLSKLIQSSVKDKYGIALEPEVNFIP